MGLKELYKNGFITKEEALREAGNWTLDPSPHSKEAYDRFVKWINQRKEVKRGSSKTEES